MSRLRVFAQRRPSGHECGPQLGSSSVRGSGEPNEAEKLHGKVTLNKKRKERKRKQKKGEIERSFKKST